MPVAVLFVLAIASIGIYGIVLGGWSSGSTYSLLGGLRSSAQMISYEVAMGLALVAVFLYAGSMSTSEIVAAQADLWFALILLPSFVIYVISMVGETNRAPFDLPEAEGELVGGFHTEYSSLKFALFFLAEYINMVTVSALATTLFLGGWPPRGRHRALGGRRLGLLAAAVVLRQDVRLHLLVHLAARLAAAACATTSSWRSAGRCLIPISLVWIVAVATIRVDHARAAASTGTYLVVAIAVLLVLSWCCCSSATARAPTTRPRPRPTPRPSRTTPSPAASPSRRCPPVAPYVVLPRRSTFAEGRTTVDRFSGGES